MLLAALFVVAALSTAPLSYAQEHGSGAPEHSSGPAAQGEHGSSVPSPAEHASAATEHGEGHAEAEMPNEIWWKWANFALLAAGLGYLIGKHAPGFFRSRSEQIQRGIAEATRTREEAEARAAEIERRVANLSSEVEQLRAQSREEIAREGERVRVETEAAIRKIQAQSQAEINSVAKHAAHDLKAYSAKMALELAEGQIRNRMSEPMQDGLTSAFILDLRRKADKN